MAADFRMLCVFAHPDDECYGPGGAIAWYAMRGVEVHILMFTCGEAGSIGISRTLDADELCRRRRLEFDASCQALGVAGHRIVGAPDKGVNTLEEETAAGEISRELERVRPQVVLTFHHRGVSGHPDHIAVAAFLDRAFDAAGADGPLAYYQWGIPRALERLYDRPNLVPMEEEEVAVVLDIPVAAMERKIAAIESHETQVEFFQSLQDLFDYRVVGAREFFSLRRSRPPFRRPRGARGGDLFAGVPGWGDGGR